VFFAAGSPFEPVEYEGKKLEPGQANNVFIYPGVGLGAYLCKAKVVTDGMLIAASISLADFVSESEMKKGNIYPKVADIRAISKKIACAVMEKAVQEGVCKEMGKSKMKSIVEENFYDPHYEDLAQKRDG